MTASKRIRQVHRWLSIAFTAGFLVNSAVIFSLKGSQPPSWIYLLALIPLFLLFGTGLYLFALPHVVAWRGGGKATARA